MFKRIYGILGELRMPVSELAKELKISPKTLHNKLNGKTDFTYSEMTKIQKLIGSNYTLDELFEFTIKAS